VRDADYQPTPAFNHHLLTDLNNIYLISDDSCLTVCCCSGHKVRKDVEARDVHWTITRIAIVKLQTVYKLS
jgi:hypothetical protein